MVAAILALVQKLLGIFFPDKAAPTPEAVAEKTGEDAGKAKAENAAAQTAITEVKTAQEVRAQVKAETAAEVKAGAPPADDGFRRD